MARKFTRTISALLMLAAPGVAAAADHAEAPAVVADPAADIADVFLFRAEGRLVAAMSFAGIAAPNPRIDGPTGTYDADVLYRFHFDTDLDGSADYVVDARFAQDDDGDWGIQLENLPGAGTRYVSGPVEGINRTDTGLRFYAGLRDDPFFFDSQGFNATLATFGDPDTPSGQILIRNDRDSFGFRNLTFIVFEMDETAARRGASEIRFWGTTARIAGGAQ